MTKIQSFIFQIKIQYHLDTEPSSKQKSQVTIKCNSAHYFRGLAHCLYIRCLYLVI
jgi:hypothetical protein